MRIAYVCADPGVPVLGNKGASVHVREFTDALVELGHQVEIFSAAGPAPGASNAGLDPEPPVTGGKGVCSNTTRAPLTVLAPSERVKHTSGLVAAGLARLDARHVHTHLFSEVLHIIADPEFVNVALPLLRAFAPDLIIARHALFSTAGPALARSLGCPCVLEVNAPLVEERRRYWDLTLEREAEQVERTVFAEADLLVAVSEGVRDYLLRYDAPRERIVVLPNGVNLTRFHPRVDGRAVRRHYGLEDRPVVGFSGSLKPWHGIDLLLRAFASLYELVNYLGERGETALHGPRRGAPALLIVGDGPQREQLEGLAREWGVSAAVTFTGAVPHAEVPAHLAAMDIAVAPYRSSDGFYFSPLKVMEYMAMGLPTVAPVLGQIPSLLQGAGGACGLLYPPDDLHELAAALLRLVDDGGLRLQLGARAAAQARLRSSWQAIAQQIVERAQAEKNPAALQPLEAVQL